MISTIRGLLCRPRKWRNTAKTAWGDAFAKVKHLGPNNHHRVAVTAENRAALRKVLAREA